MVNTENDFLKRLQATFKIEAEEHVKNMSAGLIELEKAATPDKQGEIIEIIFREAHSLKGAARSVNVTDVETICHSLESIFSSLKRLEIKLSPVLLDTLHHAVDNLRKVTDNLSKERTVEEKNIVSATLKLLESAVVRTATMALTQETTESPMELKKPAETTVTPPALAETVRISVPKLESLLLQVEELLSAKLAADDLSTNLRNLSNDLNEWEREWTKVSPQIRAVRKLFTGHGYESDKSSPAYRVLEFLDWNYQMTKTTSEKFTRINRTADIDQHSLSGMVDNLLEDMKLVLMLPFTSLTEIFPKFVRELAREQGKEIKLVIKGEGIEIDRRILEEFKDPLIHLLRNCIDHGIEKPAERLKKGKPSEGTIVISIIQKDSGTVELAITDDGIGIDVNKVREAAVKRDVITSEAADKLSETQVLSLIYVSGVSTSPIMTDISGHGLGLAIVQEKVEKLHGSLTVETVPDAGTTFLILLPLTLATFRGILIRVDDHFFILPTASVERVLRVKKEEIHTVENRETISFNSQIVSLVRLSDVLAIPRGSTIEHSSPYMPLAIVSNAGKRLAFEVDEIVNEQEVLVKNLGRQLSRVRHIMGASVLATGKVVPILNVADLMKSAVKITPVGEQVKKTAQTKQKSLLVVEDSITARTLLKNILEMAGYAVKTAIDGVDAFTILRTGEFDLVISDVDMPRMNGFDLTEKIRGDKKLGEIPVILVTALESREHRERGIAVGADAYIVKSSFDQSNLLAVIQRFI